MVLEHVPHLQNSVLSQVRFLRRQSIPRAQCFYIIVIRNSSKQSYKRRWFFSLFIELVSQQVPFFKTTSEDIKWCQKPNLNIKQKSIINHRSAKWKLGLSYNKLKGAYVKRQCGKVLMPIIATSDVMNKHQLQLTPITI